MRSLLSQVLSRQHAAQAATLSLQNNSVESFRARISVTPIVFNRVHPHVFLVLCELIDNLLLPRTWRYDVSDNTRQRPLTLSFLEIISVPEEYLIQVKVTAIYSDILAVL